jgi:hypothetical protein
MTHTIARMTANRQPDDIKPLASLPARLDAKACFVVLEQLGLGAASAVAAGNKMHLDIKDVDAALSASSLSISDRMRFKESLSANGLIARGVPVKLPFVRG